MLIVNQINAKSWLWFIVESLGKSLKKKICSIKNEKTKRLKPRSIYEESLKDFTRLYQLFYNTKVKIIKHCGCA
jgi:hypothetical protein